MTDILKQIIENKALEVGEARVARPLNELKEAVRDLAPVHSLHEALKNTPGGIIAEFKRRSPSKGWIKKEAQVANIIPAYEEAGAAALSILTDKHFFGGTLSDVEAARPLTHLPILRKEFIIDAYQLYEARAAGADACLLIAAVLGAARCHELTTTAHEIGLEVLLEIHSAEEIEAISPDVDVIGVNNRNLRTFVTDPVQSMNLRPLLPQKAFPISESGLLNPHIARQLREEGYCGFLVGEAFMKADKPGEALRQYLEVLIS